MQRIQLQAQFNFPCGKSIPNIFQNYSKNNSTSSVSSPFLFIYYQAVLPKIRLKRFDAFILNVEKWIVSQLVWTTPVYLSKLDWQIYKWNWWFNHSPVCIYWKTGVPSVTYRRLGWSATWIDDQFSFSNKLFGRKIWTKRLYYIPTFSGRFKGRRYTFILKETDEFMHYTHTSVVNFFVCISCYFINSECVQLAFCRSGCFFRWAISMFVFIVTFYFIFFFQKKNGQIRLCNASVWLFVCVLECIINITQCEIIYFRLHKNFVIFWKKI